MALELSGTNKITHDNLNQNIKDLLTPKNWIINGGFDVWQRGTSQTSAGYGSDDRWANEHSGSTKTSSQQPFSIGQTDVPNNPKYFSRTVATSVVGISNFVCKIQKIEDVTKLAGKVVTLSFWAKADSNKNISIEFIQDFGTGGSARVEALGVQKFALTTSWQRFTKTFTFPTINGKTIGVDNNIRLTIWFDAGSNFNSRTDSLGNQSGTFDIANVSLVEGSVPVEWQTEAYADVLRQCQRYYLPISSDGGQYTILGSMTADGTPYAHLVVNFPVDMRIPPTSITTSAMSSFYWTGPVVGNTPTSITINTKTTRMVDIVITKTNAFSIGASYVLLSNNLQPAFIGISAEL